MGAWKTIDGDKHAIAICSFNHNDSHTLKFKIGDCLILKEETDDWFLGSLVSESGKFGIFPKNYVQIYDPVKFQHKDQSVNEIEGLLREWTTVWYSKYEECEKKKNVQILVSCFVNLLNLRNNILANRASIDEIKELKKSTADKILKGNHILGLDVVVTDNEYNRLDATKASTVFLFEGLKRNANLLKHSNAFIRQTTQNNNDDWQNLPQPTPNSRFYHNPSITSLNYQTQSRSRSIMSTQSLMQHASIHQQSRSLSTYSVRITLENLQTVLSNNFDLESTQLYVNLFTIQDNEAYYLCENAIVDMNQISNDRNSRQSVGNMNSVQTLLFCDLNEKDFKTDKQDSKLFLLAYVVKNIRVTHDTNFTISKLVAAGVQDIGYVFSFLQLSSDKRHFQNNLHLFINDFDGTILNLKTLNELLNMKEQLDQVKLPKNSTKDSHLVLVIKGEIFEAAHYKIIEQFTYFKAIICRKMSFPEIIMPDDYRNDFYITVVNGEFTKAKAFEFIVNLVQFKRDVDKWVEVGIDLDDDVELVKQATLGAKKFFSYKSIVYSKQDKPKWHEIIKISIPTGKKVEKIKNMYLRFIIRTRSLDGSKDKTKFYGKCYLKITNDDGSAIEDKSNFQLWIQKVDDNEFLSVDSSSFIRLKPVNLPIQQSTAPTNSQSQQPLLLSNLLNGSISNPGDKNKEFLLAKVNVVSTQLTQNATLLKLLSFQTEKKPDQQTYLQLKEYLEDLYRVKDQQSAEIVKFLQPLFEKLIDILLDLNIKHNTSIDDTINETHKNEIQPLVFKILVAIFQIIENQNKFASFRDVIDAYLNKNFSITLAHRPLFRLLTNNIRLVHDYFYGQLHKSSNQSVNDALLDYIINVIKSMEYIFKFAFKSRELLSLYKINHKQSDNVDHFDKDISAIFSLLTGIVRLKNTINSTNSAFNQNLDLFNTSSIIETDKYVNNFETNIIKTQSFILKNVINLLPILIQSKRFSLVNIAEFYSGFLESIYCLKTQFLSKLIKSKLFESCESRGIIMKPLCQALSHLLLIETNDEKDKIDRRIEETGIIFAELMDVLERKDIGDVSVDMDHVCKFLPQIIQLTIYYKPSYNTIDNSKNKKHIRQIYATIIISMLRLIKPTHYQIIFNLNIKLSNSDLVNGTSSSNTLELLLYMCSSIITDDIYPLDWYDLLILRDKVVLTALSNIAERISSHHLKNFTPANRQIWQNYFDAIVAILIDPCLQIEKFTETKRKNVLQKYGDMRISGAIELANMWYSLGDNKKYFTPDILDLFLKVGLIPIKEINDKIIPLFFDMMSFEMFSVNYEIDENCSIFDELKVPDRLITQLDLHFENGSGDNGFRDSFERIFTEKFTKNASFVENIDFVKKTVELIELLMEYREFKMNSSGSDELNTFYLNELMNFYRTIGRCDLYLKYVENLRQIHVNSINSINLINLKSDVYVSAAHTITLFADLLNWTNEPIDSSYSKYSAYPSYKFHKDLKEQLFIDIIEYFTNGSAWEKAFEFSKKLRERYEAQFEYRKLCDVLKKEAALCENILNNERYFSNYFLVGFYGKKFPRLLQNQKFVFKGDTFENIGSFSPRIVGWFPKAIRLLNTTPPTDEQLNGQAKYIQIISLKPIFEPKDRFHSLNIPAKQMNYYCNNEVKKFRHTYRTNTKKLDENDPTEWWSKEITVTIDNALPNVINFYPVTEEIVLDIPPVQGAINAVKEQYDKINKNLDEIQENRKVTDDNIRIIQGSVDAGVNGGLPKYQVFFVQSYIDANPEYRDSINELKELIYSTIDISETYLFWCLKYSNHPLIKILESDQLPILKSKFSLPTESNLDKKRLIEQQTDAAMTPRTPTPAGNVFQTPIAPYHHSISQQSLSMSIEPTPTKKLSTGDLFNGSSSSTKLSSSSRKQMFLSKVSNSTPSQRESITSLRSNSDEENKKFILEETLNPKRPLRPKTQTSSNSGSNSTHNSRPTSHISDDGTQLSLLPTKFDKEELKFYNEIIVSPNIINDENKQHQQQTPIPPPKPPKPLNALKKFNIQQNGDSPSSSSSSPTDSSNVILRNKH